MTADELLGIDVSRKAAERDKIIAEVMALSKNGRSEELLVVLKEGLKRFPNDAALMALFIDESTVYVSSRDCTEEEKTRIAEECRGYSEYILEHSANDDARHSAIDYLSRYYHRKGENEKAWEYARKLSILCNSREFLSTSTSHHSSSAREAANSFFVYSCLGFSYTVPTSPSSTTRPW